MGAEEASQLQVALVLTVDQNFAMQLATAVASIASSGTHVRTIFVVHHGLSALDRARIDVAGEGLEIRWVAADPTWFLGVRVPAYVTDASMLRLAVAEFVTAEFDRVIYLDADVIVRASLDELAVVDLEDRAVAAVRDAVVPWSAAPAGPPWEMLGIPPDEPYLNAGVMVIDLRHWRDADIGNRARELCRAHALPYGDQCALNVVLTGNWTRLDPRWNVQAGHFSPLESLAWITEDTRALHAALAEPAVVHFNTSSFGRPWLPGCCHPLRDVWFDALAKTPWASWRPSRPPRVRVAAQRVLRGARSTWREALR